jgi:hypothetical protein
MNCSRRLVSLSLALALGGFASPAFAQRPAQTQPSSPPAVAVPTPAQVQASTAEAKRLSEGFVAVAERAVTSI